MLVPGAWTPGNISTAGQEIIYPLEVTIGQTYEVTWDDVYDGTNAYNGNIKVSAYRSNTTTAYFSNIDAGYTTHQKFKAEDEVVYIVVEGANASATGNFAIKASTSEQ